MNPARSKMTMRAVVQQNDVAMINDEWGNPIAPEWSDKATIACYVWSRTKEHVTDGEKVVIIETIRGIFPLDAAVTEADRIANVKNRTGDRTYFHGPISIDEIWNRTTHMEFMGRTIDA